MNMLEYLRNFSNSITEVNLKIWIKQIAAAVQYCHSNLIVHRDLKLQNILCSVEKDGNIYDIKLADFGMTRPMFENDYYRSAFINEINLFPETYNFLFRFSRRGMLPVRWMSPESLADGIFTPMSDIWSYGVLLYEIITFGSFPFQV